MGAVIALLGVGYEIRQPNMIATRETLSTNWSNATNFELSNLESGIAKIRAKAMVSANKLTLEGMINPDSYLTAYVLDYHQNYIALEVNDSPELLDVVLDELTSDAPRYFGSRFARAWLLDNRTWMIPEIAAAISSGIEGAPVGSELAYYGRIQLGASTLE